MTIPGGIPPCITKDPLWKMRTFRVAVEAADFGWTDVTVLVNDRRTREISSQLYRALGSVEANIAEGYSRSSGRDRARLYEYALGSAREARCWYLRSRFILGTGLAEARCEHISGVVRMLLALIPHERGRRIQPDNVR